MVVAIQEICRLITDVSAISGSVAAAVEEQGAVTQEIARNVQQAAVGTEKVSANVAGLGEVVGKTGTAASAMLGAAGQLTEQAERLGDEVDRFLGTVRAA
ncbi:hypothetical protein [Azospirillum palustre]